jgi:hypothetical protein
LEITSESEDYGLMEIGGEEMGREEREGGGLINHVPTEITSPQRLWQPGWGFLCEMGERAVV